MIRIRTAAARTAAVAAIIGAAGLGAAGLASAATPYTASDLTYLDILDENDITYTSTDFAIDMGYEICYQIDNGASLDEVASTVDYYSSMSDYDNGIVIGAAIVAYCPAYAPA